MDPGQMFDSSYKNLMKACEAYGQRAARTKMDAMLVPLQQQVNQAVHQLWQVGTQHGKETQSRAKELLQISIRHYADGQTSNPSVLKALAIACGQEHLTTLDANRVNVEGFADELADSLDVATSAASARRTSTLSVSKEVAAATTHVGKKVSSMAELRAILAEEKKQQRHEAAKQAIIQGANVDTAQAEEYFNSPEGTHILEQIDDEVEKGVQKKLQMAEQNIRASQLQGQSEGVQPDDALMQEAQDLAYYMESTLASKKLTCELCEEENDALEQDYNEFRDQLPSAENREKLDQEYELFCKGYDDSTTPWNTDLLLSQGFVQKHSDQEGTAYRPNPRQFPLLADFRSKSHPHLKKALQRHEYAMLTAGSLNYSSLVRKQKDHIETFFGTEEKNQYFETFTALIINESRLKTTQQVLTKGLWIPQEDSKKGARRY